MDRRETMTKVVLGLIGAGLVVAPMVGCATGSDRQDSANDEVVGQPPDEDSEDYEFAPPPSHPGEHGDVADSTSRDSMAESPSEPGVVTDDDIDELQRYGPSVVMQHVETEPAYDETEEFVGFEIVDVSETARHYLEPKLEIGDVVTHVNLVRLEKPDDYMEAWETLEGAEEIRVDVVRDGGDEEIVWEIK